MGKLTLLTGGSRSGKSTYALKLASGYGDHRVFIATALATDDEMKARIDKHKHDRGQAFNTVEAPYNLADAIMTLDSECSVAVVDCLTVWLGNMFYKFDNDDRAIEDAISGLCLAVQKRPFDLILVTNEVGMGIVPDNALARRFRDAQGSLNQRIAACADAVYLCCCGIPLEIK
jgi:adenosylcobinamide kinase / adenosylcobinamide-phosphate guanylyltransferase